MSVALVHAAVLMDLAAIRRHATPHVENFLRACESNDMQDRMLAYCVKNLVLSGKVDAELQSIAAAEACGLSVDAVAKRPSIGPLFARLTARYDQATAIKAVERAMRMTAATVDQYAASDKMVDDLVLQLSNRDDRKNAKAKRH